MPYVRHSGAEQISVEALRVLARAADLAVPEEDLEPLAAALSDQLASVRDLYRLDLSGINPAPEFDPRWHEGETR